MAGHQLPVINFPCNSMPPAVLIFCLLAIAFCLMFKTPTLYSYIPVYLYTLASAISAICFFFLTPQASSLKTIKMQNKPNLPLFRAARTPFPAQYQRFVKQTCSKSPFPAQFPQTQFTPCFARDVIDVFRSIIHIYDIIVAKILDSSPISPNPNLPNFPAPRALRLRSKINDSYRSTNKNPRSYFKKSQTRKN